MWNSLSTWLEEYLGEALGTHSGFEYAAQTAPVGSGALVTLGFMPEAPPEVLTLTGYNYPEGTAPGSVTASVQVRGRATTRATATSLVEAACRHLTNPSNTPRLDRVTRTNLQPIGRDQMGHFEVTANLLIETIERTP